ncbi:MAG: hypothetical protein ABI165_04270 [Bryobacteraceae bacterium]
MQTIVLIFGGVIRLAVYGLVVAMVYWVFTIARDISDIKDMVRDFKRTNDLGALAGAVAHIAGQSNPPSPAAPPDYETMARLVDEPPRAPEVMEERRA